MKNIEDICLIISARLNSHRIPQKMIAPFANTTLLDITLKKLLNSKVIPKENVILAVHEPELIAIGKEYGVKIYHRSEASSQSEGKNLKILYEWYDDVDFKYVVLVNPCAPFLSIDTIDDFFLSYAKNEHDGLFGVIAKKNYFWNSDREMITNWPNGFEVMNTKFVGVTYEAAHCLYASKMSIIEKGIWMAKTPYTKNNPELFPMSELEAFDIDYPWQFNVAESLYRELP